MVPGRRIVSGVISLIQLLLGSKWPICSGINFLLPNITLLWALGGKVILKCFKSNSYPVNYKSAFSKYLNS